eukprot:gene14225-20196_t
MMHAASRKELLLITGVAAASVALLYSYQRWRRKQGPAPSSSHGDLLSLIGNTPLIRIASLCKETGCEILGKCEFLNPGGSVKDRVALQIVQEALADGRLQPGGLVTEGTAGSTGVSLSMVTAALGLRCFIAMPDDAAIEKVQMLQALGTGGTISGVSCVLKKHNPSTKVYLIDPPGSGLYNKGQRLNWYRYRHNQDKTRAVMTMGKGSNGRLWVPTFMQVTRGVLYTHVEAEGKRLKNPFDTVTRGVLYTHVEAEGKRLKNPFDTVTEGTDREAVEMAHYLLRNDGLFVGSSAAMNCVGAVKAARQLGPGHTIVLLLCDGGARHLSKFHNTEYLEGYGLAPQEKGLGLGFVA